MEKSRLRSNDDYITELSWSCVSFSTLRWFSAMICESQQWQYSCAVETQPCIHFVEESANIQIRKLPETRDTRISTAFSAVLTVFTISNGTGCSASGCQFQAAPWGEDNENKNSTLHFKNFRLSLLDFFCSLWQCYWNLLSLSLVNKLLSKRLPAEKKLSLRATFTTELGHLRLFHATLGTFSAIPWRPPVTFLARGELIIQFPYGSS